MKPDIPSKQRQKALEAKLRRQGGKQRPYHSMPAGGASGISETMREQYEEIGAIKKKKKQDHWQDASFYWNHHTVKESNTEEKPFSGSYIIPFISVGPTADGSIKTHMKQTKDILPDHIHNEIEVALKIFKPMFLKHYSRRKIEVVTWNKQNGTIVTALPVVDGEIPFIEYQLADQLLKLEKELTPKIISDCVLEGVMKMCLHAKDM